MYNIVCENRNGLYEYYYFDTLMEAKSFYRENKSNLDILEVRVNENNGYYETIDLKEWY